MQTASSAYLAGETEVTLVNIFFPNKLYISKYYEFNFQQSTDANCQQKAIRLSTFLSLI